MMCTMQNHIIQVFANSGNVIKPIGVLNELKSKLFSFDTSSLIQNVLPEMRDRRRCLTGYILNFGGKYFVAVKLNF